MNINQSMIKVNNFNTPILDGNKNRKPWNSSNNITINKDSVTFQGQRKNLNFIWELSQSDQDILNYKIKNVSVDEIKAIINKDSSLKLLHDDLQQTNLNVSRMYKTYNALDIKYGNSCDKMKSDLYKTGLTPRGAKVPILGLFYTVGEVLTDLTIAKLTTRNHILPEEYANICFKMEDIHDNHVRKYFNNGISLIHNQFKEKTNNIGTLIPKLQPIMKKQQLAEQKAFEAIENQKNKLTDKVYKNSSDVFDKYASNLYIRLITKAFTLGLL